MAAGGRRGGGSIIIILAILLIVGLAAVFFLFRGQILGGGQPQAEEPTAQPQDTMVNIVITTQSVARGTTLTDGVVTTVPYPEKDLIQGTFYTDVKDVIGKSAKYDLDAHMPLTASLIADKQAGSDASFQIPKGMVAITIPITRLAAVSFAPVEGDHVNVIASIMLTDVDPAFQSRLPNNSVTVVQPGLWGEGMPPSLTVSIPGASPQGGQAGPQGRVEMDGNMNQPVYVIPSEVQRPRPVTQTLIQDAIVLHVGGFDVKDDKKDSAEQQPADPNATPTPAPQPQDGTQPTAVPQEPRDITLVVSPQDAVTLNYLMLVNAKLNLVLRSAGDGEKPHTEAVTLQFLMDQYNIPNPAKLPYALEPRVDNLVMPTVQPTPSQPPQ